MAIIQSSAKYQNQFFIKKKVQKRFILKTSGEFKSIFCGTFSSTYDLNKCSLVCFRKLILSALTGQNIKQSCLTLFSRAWKVRIQLLCVSHAFLFGRIRKHIFFTNLFFLNCVVDRSHNSFQASFIHSGAALTKVQIKLSLNIPYKKLI